MICYICQQKITSSESQGSKTTGKGETVDYHLECECPELKVAKNYKPNNKIMGEEEIKIPDDGSGTTEVPSEEVPEEVPPEEVPPEEVPSEEVPPDEVPTG